MTVITCMQQFNILCNLGYKLYIPTWFHLMGTLMHPLRLEHFNNWCGYKCCKILNTPHKSILQLQFSWQGKNALLLCLSLVSMSNSDVTELNVSWTVNSWFSQVTTVKPCQQLQFQKWRLIGNKFTINKFTMAMFTITCFENHWPKRIGFMSSYNVNISSSHKF